MEIHVPRLAVPYRFVVPAGTDLHGLMESFRGVSADIMIFLEGEGGEIWLAGIAPEHLETVAGIVGSPAEQKSVDSVPSWTIRPGSGQTLDDVRGAVARCGAEPDFVSVPARQNLIVTNELTAEQVRRIFEEGCRIRSSQLAQVDP